MYVPVGQGSSFHSFHNFGFIHDISFLFFHVGRVFAEKELAGFVSIRNLGKVSESLCCSLLLLRLFNMQREAETRQGCQELSKEATH